MLSRSDGLLLSSGEQLESFYVRRAHHGEVAAVEGGNGRDVEPFRNSDDRGVGSAQAEVGVALTELGHASNVGYRQLS